MRVTNPILDALSANGDPDAIDMDDDPPVKYETFMRARKLMHSCRVSIPRRNVQLNKRCYKPHTRHTYNPGDAINFSRVPSYLLSEAKLMIMKYLHRGYEIPSRGFKPTGTVFASSIDLCSGEHT